MQLNFAYFSTSEGINNYFQTCMLVHENNFIALFQHKFEVVTI